MTIFTMYYTLLCIYIQSVVVAGFASGITEGFINIPFERVKVYMQAQKTITSEVRHSSTLKKNAKEYKYYTLV